MALTIDKELAKRVVEEIDKLALSNSASRYTFTNFCKSKNLFNENDKTLKSGSLFICCPFHHDDFPSLGINEEKRVWNCLGCSKHGRFVDFVRYYSMDVEGREISYYQQVNELLKADLELQNRVGASTIFKKEKIHESFNGASYRKFRLQHTKPKTYPELATFMKNKRFDENTIIFALLQMQSGISAELIYDSLTGNTIFNDNSDARGTDYDIDAIFAESDQPERMNVDL